MKHQTLKIDERKRIATKPDGTQIIVKDSKYSFLVQPIEEDIANGVPGDHANCMYCLACRRMYGSDLVWVARRTAYVEIKVSKNKSQLLRFMLTEPARINIEKFDNDENPSEEAVIFAAPKGSDTLDTIQQRNEERKKAYIIGERVGENHDGKKGRGMGPSRTNVPHYSALRNPATGKFQFLSKKSA